MSCWDDLAVCSALERAQCYAQGIFDECIRRIAWMAAAAHLLEIQNIQATETASRMAAASKGAVARPSGGSDQLNDWWTYTIYGKEYLQAIRRDLTIDIFVI